MNPLVKQLASAITIFEGYRLPSLFLPFGSASYRNRNPGNLRFSAYSQSLGATSSSPMGYARFPDYQTGFNALCRLITDACTDKLTGYHSTMSILQFFYRYAPPADHNNPSRYAAFVAAHVGISVDTPLSQIAKVA